MSFGVIFSIIIIIFILVVAGIAVNHFLGLKKCTQIGLFLEDLEKNINKAWNSQSSSFEFSSTLPGNLDYICFANLSDVPKGVYSKEIYSDISLYAGADANLFFYPRENACNMPYINIKHIDIKKITKESNPYCVAVEKGKVAIKIDKGFNDALVNLV